MSVSVSVGTDRDICLTDKYNQQKVGTGRECRLHPVDPLFEDISYLV